MAKANNKASLIKRPFPYIEEQLIAEIRGQVEFYFSVANLATDAHLRRLIAADRRGWVRTRELATFTRLRLLIARAFQKTPSPNEIEYLVEMAVRDSSRVQASKGRVKLRKRLVWERDSRGLLYLEREGLEEQQLLQLPAFSSVPGGVCTFKRGCGWLFLDCTALPEDQLALLHSSLHAQCPQLGIKILTMAQFRQYEQIYNNHFHSKPEETPRTTVRLPPRQLLRYDEVEVKIREKAPEVKPEKQEVDYEKIFSRYMKSRNKKTPEAYEKHRAEKIEEWRRRKELRRESRMQVE